MKIAVVGGNVGKTLGNGWSGTHQVAYVSRSQSPDERTTHVANADAIVVATPADAAAKSSSTVGGEAVDAGALSVARSTEPFALLWITMAIKGGFGREFAFSLLRR